ncbi:FecR family protein [Halalkalibaculum sp. DA384]|uniref:FecR family protein n=1 Tax=Halalkalibaculum sp. DA384 TaxID=3373606 RepID=UPI003754287C
MEIPWKKLGKYFSGNCTLQERKEIKAWIHEDATHQKIADELEEIWQDSANNGEWDIDEGWNELSKKLDSKKDSPLRLVESPFEEYRKLDQRNRKKRKWSFGVHVAAAAAVLVIALSTMIVYEHGQPAEQQETVLAMQEVVTDKGQRSQFKLSDGTRVWLNGDSRLEIPSKFNSDFREVNLKGEAFFDVESDPDKPFVIHAGESVTRVLGTQFNLHAYPDEDVHIVVEEGKVAFGNRQSQREPAELVRNQMAILTDNHVSTSKVDDISYYTGWRRGQLVFKDTPLKIAMKKLERWYDIETRLTDPSLESRTITGSYEEESMTEVLNIISLSVGMTYEKHKSTITFHPK